MKAANVKQATTVLGLLAIGATFAASVQAEMSAEELAKLAQNPVGNLISVPFQNNTNPAFRVKLSQILFSTIRCTHAHAGCLERM